MLIIYNPDPPMPGFIEQVIHDPVHPNMPATLAAHGKSFIEWRPPDLSESYVRDGKVVARPDMPLASQAAMRLGEPASLTFPTAGAAVTVRLNGHLVAQATLDSCELELCPSVPGTYEIAVELWPYKAFSCALTVTP